MAEHVPDRIGVVGGGRMGSGIAHAFLLAGSRVTLVESDDAAAAAARSAVLRAVDGSVGRGTAEGPAQQYMDRLGLALRPEEVAGCGLVVEAVPEQQEMKSGVLRAISDAVDEEALIASNTSSLSISDLAASVDHPGRFLGMHFFNPVPASQLVEVVIGDATTDESVRRALRIVTALDKVAISVSDSPGFASSRLGVLLGLEAIHMLEESVASAEDIDAAMTLGYRHPVGPLRLTDLVGLDVRLRIAEYLESTLGPRFAPPDLLRQKVAHGELGRKSGRGFYDWTESRHGGRRVHDDAAG